MFRKKKIDELSIKAEKIVKNPDLLDSIQDRYVLVWDASLNYSFENLMHAVNIMAIKGWKWIGSTSTVGGGVYRANQIIWAMMEKESYSQL